MTADEDQDPPIPEYLEGSSLKRVHTDPDADKAEPDTTGDPRGTSPDE
ncbi:hypothetical protein [Arthrobacter sp. B0490]|nr:hypothetical protein [Arthrobacter sp. B0490]